MADGRGTSHLLEEIDAGTAAPVTLGTRTMREWVAFPARQSDTATLALRRDVAQDAHHYVDFLRRPRGLRSGKRPCADWRSDRAAGHLVTAMSAG